MLIRAPALAAALLLLPLLAACSDDQSRSFGFSREGPDEFTVTTRAPLSMPPDLANVPPPRPGAPRPQEQSQTAQAEASLAPESAMGGPVAGTATPGQAALVTAAGQAAPADVRRRVDAESPVAPSERGFVDRLMFWRSDAPAGTVVDAQKEAERLRANAALGKSPEDGTTPTAQPPSQSFFDRLF